MSIYVLRYSVDSKLLSSDWCTRNRRKEENGEGTKVVKERRQSLLQLSITSSSPWSSSSSSSLSSNHYRIIIIRRRIVHLQRSLLMFLKDKSSLSLVFTASFLSCLTIINVIIIYVFLQKETGRQRLTTFWWRQDNINNLLFFGTIFQRIIPHWWR